MACRARLTLGADQPVCVCDPNGFGDGTALRLPGVSTSGPHLRSSGDGRGRLPKRYCAFYCCGRGVSAVLGGNVG